MSQKARQWLRKKTRNGEQSEFSCDKSEGRYAGSLVGLKFIKRGDTWYLITSTGLIWIGRRDLI